MITITHFPISPVCPISIDSLTWKQMIWKFHKGAAAGELAFIKNSDEFAANLLWFSSEFVQIRQTLPELGEFAEN